MSCDVKHNEVHECECNPGYVHDTLVPMVGVITDIKQQTPDVKTFRVNAIGGGKLFEHLPGQCAMVCAPGVSEGMFSITSSPMVVIKHTSITWYIFPFSFLNSFACCINFLVST